MGEAFIAGQISTVTQNITTSNTPFVRQLLGASFTILGNFNNKTADARISVNNSFQTFDDFGISNIREIRYGTNSSSINSLMEITIPSSGSSSISIPIGGAITYGAYTPGSIVYNVTVTLTKNSSGYTINVTAPSTATYSSVNMSVQSFSWNLALWISII